MIVFRFLILSSILASSIAVTAAPYAAQAAPAAQSSSPSVTAVTTPVTVTVPHADAELIVDGKTVPGTGTSRRFEAAPVASRTTRQYTFSVKWQPNGYTTITRSKTLRDPTDVSREIFETAKSLYDALGLQRARIRLVGVRMEGLVDSVGAPIQGTLDEPDHGWRDADRAVDRASARFGAGSVRPASLIPDRARAAERDELRDQRRPGQPNG